MVGIMFMPGIGGSADRGEEDDLQPPQPPPVVTKDQTKELADYIKSYKEAAEHGDAVSQYNLGAAYRWGVGVPLDKAKAVEWIRKSAEQGYAVAQRMLGHMYEIGEGLPQSSDDAIPWYKKAARQGDAESKKRLRYLQDHRSASHVE